MLPNDVDFQLELMALSTLLYDCIGKAGELGPTLDQYDRYRDKRWSPSRSMLKTFGLTPNRAGWERLLETFGLTVATLKEAVQAHHSSKRVATRHEPLVNLDASYPELRGSVRREVTYEELDDGTVIRRTTTIISLR